MATAVLARFGISLCRTNHMRFPVLHLCGRTHRSPGWGHAERMYRRGFSPQRRGMPSVRRTTAGPPRCST